MASKVDKVVLSNASALQGKYGSAGLAAIKVAIKKLQAADKARGLNTIFVALDDSKQMKAFHAKAVSNATDPEQNKVAIDGVYRALAPDYLLLLGAIDVIPHQDLKNPLYQGLQGGDPDQFAYGDIPYACEASYSQDAQKFTGPTRVVGRLPDVNGATGAPTYMVKLLATATKWKARSRIEFSKYFAVTAEVWKKSTEQSMSVAFGDATNVQNVPPSTSTWPLSQLSRLSHFFNCHGADHTPQFFGQRANKYPVSLDAAYIVGKIQEGAVVAAECCYGGQLYDPFQMHVHMGICNTYLHNKAYAFFGSTTIAYGPAIGNGQADIICQHFLRSVLTGSSLGRAALEARQSFVKSTSSPMDPSDIKTLAQFNLYGDPSITPVLSEPKDAVAQKSSVKAMGVLPEKSARLERRISLFRQGLEMSENEPTLRKSVDVPLSIVRALRAHANELGLLPESSMSFGVKHPRLPKGMPKSLLASEPLTTAYHVLFAVPPKAREGTIPPVTRTALLIGKEVGGKLTSISTVYSR